MSVKINFQQAIDLLDAAVEAKGAEHVYDATLHDGGCVYYEMAEDGTATPACIVGHVLSYIGVGHDPEWNDDSSVIDLVSKGVIDADKRTCELLLTAQNCQDRGMTWGEVVRCAQAIVDYEPTELEPALHVEILEEVTV